MIFTDPMQTNHCDESLLQPVYDRINLSSLGSPAFYQKACEEESLKFITFEELQDQLVKHYSVVLEETEKNMGKLKGKVSDNYIQNMKKGLKHWINGGKQGNLTWGIFHFIKQ